MQEADVRMVLEAIGSAAWRMNLDTFIEKLDARDDDYWREKFRDFQDMARSVAQFDSRTLYKLIS